MIKPELYIVFREDCTDKVIANKAELGSTLKTMTSGVIIERVREEYHLYHSPETKSGEGYICYPRYHLEIDPAARIRFEGSLDEYEALLNEIKGEDYDLKVFTKIQDSDAKNNFYIMDIYYRMK